MIKVGNKVRIKGDYNDFTDHLDGQILTVVATSEEPGEFLLDENTIMVADNEGYTWYIWTKNVLEVIE